MSWEADFAGQRRARGRTVRLLAFPVIVIVAAFLLGMATLSTSSLGLFADGEPEGLLAGPTRTIRSDEWYVRTPWVVRQAALGFPSRAPGGMGEHDVAVLGDLPTRSWEVVLRPQTIGYLIFGVERAFALEWWTLVAVQLIGVYCLVVALCGRPWLAVMASMLTTLSPAMQWWATPTGFLAIGCGSLTVALVLLAARVARRGHRLALGLVAGLSLGVYCATLYVPWQIGTAIVLVPIAIGGAARDVLGRPPPDRARALRSLVVAGSIAGLVAIALFGAFVVRHDSTFDAITATVYPGQRTVEKGGSANRRVFWGAAFDTFSSSKASAIVNDENQSENGSGLALIVPAGLGCLALAVSRRLRREAWPLVGAVLAGTVLAAWMLLPVPAALGELLLLSRVEPRRLFLPIAFAGVMAMVLLVGVLLDRQIRLPSWQAWACATAFALPQLWCASHYVVDGAPINLGQALGLVGYVTLAVALALGRWPAAGLGLLVALLAVQTWSIHPLQRGMDPLVANPLSAAVSQLRQATDDPDAGWVAFDSGPEVKGTLTATGVNNLSSVSAYPDPRAWHVLDPTGASERMWNRFAHVAFTSTASMDPSFELLSVDSVNVIVNPCSPKLERLGVRYFVTQGAVVGACASLRASVRYHGGQVLIFERVSG